MQDDNIHVPGDNDEELDGDSPPATEAENVSLA